jgi:hypothetical protein
MNASRTSQSREPIPVAKPGDAAAREILDLYRSEIRPFLAEYKAADLTTLDLNAEMLEGAVRAAGGLKIGFVGESQVGKSSLINALLDRLALPAGGTGPLTAQATRVKGGTENRFTATYHARKQLHQHAFALGAYLRRRGDLVAVAEPETEQANEGTSAAEMEDENTADGPTIASVVAATELVRSSEGGDEAEQGRRSDGGEYLLEQAKRILVHKNSDVDHKSVTPLQLLNALRAILGQKPAADGQLPQGLVPRIGEVKRLLGSTEVYSETESEGVAAFHEELLQRAAGWRSPLIASLEVVVTNPELEGIDLVDLPGIGTLSDPAAKEAERFVTAEGDALVIVFRNSGVTDTVAELLERTGVITKLLFAGDREVPPIQLVLAVTHLDSVAKERYRAKKQISRNTGEPLPDRHHLFRELSAEMAERLCEQVGSALRRSKSFEDLPDDDREARERVVQELIAQMKIVCVASPDYLSLKLDFDDGFLQDVEATGIPELRRHLRRMASQADDRRHRLIHQYTGSLCQNMTSNLTAVAQLFEEGKGPAVQEWERFRTELTTAAEPLRVEMAAYHGQTIGLLREGVQTEIEMICLEAETAGHKRLRRLSREGAALHYASLKAALMRDAVWSRRGVDYPTALTLAMVDHLATAWEPKIIAKVRSHVNQLVKRDVALVERLCDSARRLDARIVAEEQIEAQKRLLQEHARAAVSWTREQLEELSDAVAKSLRGAIERPIVRACKRAIQAGIQYGTGAKNRILAAFEDGGEEAVSEARGTAEAVLKKHYAALLRRLEDGFLKEHHDSISSALAALTDEEIMRAKRSDAQRKRQVTTRVARYRERLAALCA